MADGSVEIDGKLTTEGVEKGVKKIDQELKKVERTAEKTTKKTAVDFKKLDTVMQEASNTASGFANKISSAASSGGLYVAAAVAAISATKKIGEVMRECTDAYKVQEKAERALEIAAKNNPYLDGQAVAGLKAFASELQAVSEIGDETSIKLMAQLAATGRTEAQIKAIMKAAADYAAGTGTDIQSAVQTLNATFSGQAGALGRQIDGIKNLTEEELKNGEAVKVVAEKYKGLAENLADVKVQAEGAKGDFKEMVGALLAPTTDLWDRFWKGFYEKGSAAVGWVSDALDTFNFNNAKFLRDMTTKALKQNESYTSAIWTFPTEELERAVALLEKKKHIVSALKKEEQNLYDKATAALKRRRNDEALKKAQELAAAKAAEAAKAAKAAEEKDRKTADDYAKKSNEQLAKNIKALELEAKAKGEGVKAQDLFNIYLKSYIDLLTNTEGKIKEGYPVVQKRLKQMKAVSEALNGQADAEKRLQKAIEATQVVINTLNDMKIAPTPLQDFDAQIVQYKTLQNKIKELSAEAVIKAQEGNETVYTKEQLLTQLKEREVALEKEKIREIAGIQKDAFEAYKEQQHQRLELKKAIDKSEVLSEKEKQQAKAEIDEKYAKEKIARAHTVMAQINQYTQQAAQIAQDAGNLMLESVKNEQKLEMAAINEKYEKGAMSETEYTQKIKDIKKKAAQEEYKIQMFQWTAKMLAATANIAEGVSKAISLGVPMGFIAAPLVAAAGAVQIASIVASKPIPPNFAHGGIVGGSSYYGDNINAHVNSGEMITNFPQQKRLWAMLNGENQYKPSFPITVNNTQSNRVSAAAHEQNGEVFIEIIDKHINKGFIDGTYDGGFAGMQGRAMGVNIQ